MRLLYFKKDTFISVLFALIFQAKLLWTRIEWLPNIIIYFVFNLIYKFYKFYTFNPFYLTFINVEKLNGFI